MLLTFGDAEALLDGRHPEALTAIALTRRIDLRFVGQRGIVGLRWHG